ncbi:MAG TPA: hypothetical protein PLQ05_06580 [Acidobacteriota bacterium]|nr:hypothetical protein [Acidobacteriota bacterium]
MTIIGIILVGVFFLGIAQLFTHRKALIFRYMSRQTCYREWLARYGKDHKVQIQRYLRCFGDSFFVSPTILHKLSPDDGILDYYQEDYKTGGPDFLECNYFARALQSEFGYEIEEEDGNLTMGQLFEKVTRIERLGDPPCL